VRAVKGSYADLKTVGAGAGSGAGAGGGSEEQDAAEAMA
jgi:hypothetical protein